MASNLAVCRSKLWSCVRQALLASAPLFFASLALPGTARGDDPTPGVPTPKPGNANAPVRIVVSGDRLVVTSDDPEALALVQQLVRALTADNAAADFTVIRLKNARAADAAKILDELYNGPTQQPNLPPAAFGFLRPGSTAPAAGQRPTRIRVVADSGSNSLLVRARPLDLLGIQHLLASAIDVAETDSAAVQRTWVLRPLKHADAGEVARTLRDVYRVQMSNGGAAPGYGIDDAIRWSGTNCPDRGPGRGPRGAGAEPLCRR